MYLHIHIHVCIYLLPYLFLIIIISIILIIISINIIVRIIVVYVSFRMPVFLFPRLRALGSPQRYAEHLRAMVTEGSRGRRRNLEMQPELLVSFANG